MTDSVPIVPRSRALYVITGLLLVGAVYLARPILVPLALSLLLAMLLAPLVKGLERLRLGRVISVALVSACSFSVVLGVGWLVLIQAWNVAENIPVYRANISARIKDVRGSLESTFGKASQAVEEIRQEMAAAPPKGAGAAEHAPTGQALAQPPLVSNEPGPLRGPPGPPEPPETPVKVEVVPDQTASIGTITRTLGSAVQPLITASLAFVFAVFILIWREDLRDRVIRVFGADDVNVTTLALTETARSVTRYVFMLFVVNGTDGLAVAGGLWLIGLPNALLWGLLFAVLRFMPLVGTFIAAALPILLSLAIFDGWTSPLLVIGLYILVDAVSGNVLEPLLYGAHTGASSFAVLVAILVWTWLWGPVGLILAMPLTVSLVALGRFVPELSFLTILLGNQPALSPDVRLYQRLLAGDAPAARRVFELSLRSAGLGDAFEGVMLPAIIRAKRDHNRGALDPPRERFLRGTLDELIAESHQRELEALAAVRDGQTRPQLPASPVFCVPAFGRYDELTARILAGLLEQDGVSAKVVSRKLLAGELLQVVQTEHPRIVCITAIGDDGKIRARYLVKRLMRQYRDLQIVIGLWATTADSSTIEEVAPAGDVDIATSLSELRRIVGEKALAAALKERAERVSTAV